MKIKQVLEALERFAPLPLQESWDNAGLQIGLTEAEVSGALLCLDVTEQVVSEAIAKGCNLVVSHHPLLFRGLKQVSDFNDVQRTVRLAVKHDIGIISMHTNLDNAQGGVNWKIAEKLGLQNVEFFATKKVGDVVGGSGVVGWLDAELAADAFIAKVKQSLNAACVMTNELLRRPVAKVALCGGAGDFLVDEAIALGADAFLTGEMHYHQYFGYEQKLQICVVGHYESEQFTPEIFRDILARDCAGLTTEIATTITNPIKYH